MRDTLPTLLTGMPDAEAVRALEHTLADLPQVDLLTKQDNVCVVFGDITVTTDEGPQRLTGFHVLPAKAGAKRAGIAHGDTWWTTLMTTEHTEAADIEQQMTALFSKMK